MGKQMVWAIVFQKHNFKLHIILTKVFAHDVMFLIHPLLPRNVNLFLA